jgi:predicted RecA/RadA family phage recombinase
MRNHVKPGVMVTLVAGAGGVQSGQLVFAGSIFGVAATSAAEGEEFEVHTGDVWELPKTAAEAWVVGDKIYATAAGICTKTSSGNTHVGTAAFVAANPSGTGKVRLNASFA